MAASTINSDSSRIDALDIFRGFGIMLVIAYHFSWDLSYFGWANFQLFTDPFWLGARTFIVSIFLISAGFSYALARQGGLTTSKYLRRFGTIIGAAILVTGGTWVAFPNGFVFFGILHNLALASVLILLVDRLPPLVLAATGIVVIALPEIIRFDIFSAPWLLWVGLATSTPFSVDYVPIFPWFGTTLIGLAVMRSMLGAPSIMAPVAAWRPQGPVSVLLRWSGRHTLIIYLIHQPILFGGLWVIDRLTSP